MSRLHYTFKFRFWNGLLKEYPLGKLYDSFNNVNTFCQYIFSVINNGVPETFQEFSQSLLDLQVSSINEITLVSFLHAVDGDIIYYQQMKLTG